MHPTYVCIAGAFEAAAGAVEATVADPHIAHNAATPLIQGRTEKQAVRQLRQVSFALQRDEGQRGSFACASLQHGLIDLPAALPLLQLQRLRDGQALPPKVRTWAL